MNWPRAALILTALGFLGFGAPLPMARMTEIPLPTPTARTDFAATYGGVQLALAVFFLVASRRSAWLEPALWAAAAVLAGLILVRLQSMLAFNGRPARVIVIAIAIEATGFLACVHALRSHRRTTAIS